MSEGVESVFLLDKQLDQVSMIAVCPVKELSAAFRLIEGLIRTWDSGDPSFERHAVNPRQITLTAMK